MATIKLEILLDSNEHTDVITFSNLMNAFSGAPTVQVLNTGGFPVEVLNKTLETQSPSTANKVTVSEAEQEIKGVQSTTTEIRDYSEDEIRDYSEDEIRDYSEDEMMAMPNTNLKDYVSRLGIDWAKSEGKNTNRKLANLVLEFREVASTEKESPAAEITEEETPTETVEETPTETVEDLTKEDEDLGGDKITYNDLKVSLGKKVDEHRPKIIEELAKYGATKMPNLAEEHWTDMFNFMEAL